MGGLRFGLGTYSRPPRTRTLFSSVRSPCNGAGAPSEVAAAARVRWQLRPTRAAAARFVPPKVLSARHRRTRSSTRECSSRGRVWRRTPVTVRGRQVRGRQWRTPGRSHWEPMEERGLHFPFVFWQYVFLQLRPLPQSCYNKNFEGILGCL